MKGYLKVIFIISLIIGGYGCTRQTDVSEEIVDINKPLSELSPMDKDIIGEPERPEADAEALLDDSEWEIDITDEGLE